MFWLITYWKIPENGCKVFKLGYMTDRLDYQLVDLVFSLVDHLYQDCKDWI